MSTIWSISEATCWSRDFTYKDYVLFVDRNVPHAVKLSEHAYKLFCQMMEYELGPKNLINEKGNENV